MFLKGESGTLVLQAKLDHRTLESVLSTLDEDGFHAINLDKKKEIISDGEESGIDIEPLDGWHDENIATLPPSYPPFGKRKKTMRTNT